MSSNAATTISPSHAVAVEFAARVGGTHSTFRDNERIVVTPQALHDALREARDGFGFAMLIDITAIDYLEYPEATERFGVVYLLANYAKNTRIIVKTHVSPPQAELPTATDLWRGADWMEREILDLFGITFKGHPDPRRILMPDEFTEHPLRKDYPLKGRGERHNFPVLTRAES